MTGSITRALIVVDVQNDFCEGGSLAVTGGAGVAARITERAGDYRVVAGTQDWHVDPGAHFAVPPDSPDYVDTWPVHCVGGTVGAQPHPDLDPAAVQDWFRKGLHEAAYSGFEGATADGSRLADWLAERGVTAVDVVGLATDHCVRATALDAVRSGFETRVLLDLVAGVASDTTETALAQLANGGVTIL